MESLCPNPTPSVCSVIHVLMFISSNWSLPQIRASDTAASLSSRQRTRSRSIAYGLRSSIRIILVSRNTSRRQRYIMQNHVTGRRQELLHSLPRRRESLPGGLSTQWRCPRPEKEDFERIFVKFWSSSISRRPNLEDKSSSSTLLTKVDPDNFLCGQDWPPKKELSLALPELHGQMEQTVPVPDMARADGVLNFAAYWPGNANMSDLGDSTHRRKRQIR